MEIGRISSITQTQKREQRKNAAAAGLTGAFWGAAAGVVAGNLRKPDIFEYTQTIDNIGKKEIKSIQKELRKIADVMAENKAPSRKQGELIKRLGLEGYGPKELRISASLLGRTNDTTAILRHLENKTAKLENHVKTLKNIDPNITPGSQMEKSLLKKYIQNNPNEFTVINDAQKPEIKSFGTIDEAVSFLENRIKKYSEITEKTLKIREAKISVGIETFDIIRETFADKKNEFRKFVVNEFKSAKAKKYAIWGALTAGITAAAADFASNAHSKKVFIPVEKIVPVPMPVVVDLDD